MTSTTPAAPAPGRRPRIKYLDPDALLKARVKAQLSQAELAAKAGHGITQSMVSHWEIGRRGTGLRTLAVLAEALGVTSEDLMPAELRARIGAAGKPTEGGAAA